MKLRSDEKLTAVIGGLVVGSIFGLIPHTLVTAKFMANMAFLGPLFLVPCAMFFYYGFPWALPYLVPCEDRDINHDTSRVSACTIVLWMLALLLR